MIKDFLKEFFPQATMFLLAVVIELGVPIFLSKPKQKRLVKILGVILLCLSLLWLVVAYNNQATELETPVEADDITTTVSSTNILIQTDITTTRTSENTTLDQSESLVKDSAISQLITNSQINNNSVIGSVEGNSNVIVQGEGNTVNLSNKLPEMTDENIDTIVADALPQVQGVWYKVILRPPNKNPVLFIIYTLQDHLYARAVQNENERWAIKWEQGIGDAAIFATSPNSYVLGYPDAMQDNYVIFTGCRPHFCDSAWGFVFFDAIKLDGWFLNVIGSKDEPIGLKIDAPRGYPSDPRTLYLFQRELYQYSFAANFKEVLLSLPEKRNIPPMPLQYPNDPESILAKINDPDVREIVNVFWADTDTDQMLEKVVFTNNGDLFESVRIYIFDEERVDLIYSAGDYSGFWMYFGVYPSLKAYPYLVFGTMMGAAGSVVDVTIFQYDGQAYIPITGDNEHFLRQELNIKGWPYD